MRNLANHELCMALDGVDYFRNTSKGQDLESQKWLS